MRYPAWLAREPAIRFAAFRIVLGMVLLADVAHLYVHRSLFAAEWDRGLPLSLMLILWLIALSAFIAGVQTRAAALANYLCAVSVLGRPSALSQVAGDSVAISLSLLAVFFPCGAALGLDSWARRTRQSPRSIAATRWALAGYLSAVYVDSALRKLHSPLWRAGLGVIAPAGLPSLAWTDTSWLALFPPSVLRLMGWGVIAFELFFPVLYAWQWTRTPTVLTGIALHLGIAVIYPFPVFSGLMLTIYAGLLPQKWYVPLLHLDAWVMARLHKPRSVRAGALRSFAPGLRWRWRLASLAAILWLLLCAGTYVADFAPGLRLSHTWDTMSPLIFATTGITGHGVFDDSLFADYRYQLRLMPPPSSAQSTPMPYARDGLFAWSVRDRVWEHWWKRTQAPWLPLHDAQLRLAYWAAYYWPATTGPHEVRLEVRPQRIVLDGVDATLFRENNAVPWRELATIRVAPGRAPELTWVQPPRPEEKQLGDFIRRVLAQKDRPSGAPS